MSKNIAIIADVHSNYPLLKTILDELSVTKIDTVLFLGDYISDCFENNEVLNLIKKYKYVIAGNRELSICNYDGYSWNQVKQFQNLLYTYNSLTKDNIEYLKTLKHYEIINLNNKRICLSHGTPNNPRQSVFFNSYNIFDSLIKAYNCDVYLFAHTHEAFCTLYKNKIFINPGSLILPADSPSSKYGLLDLNTLTYTPRSITYNLENMRNYYTNHDFFFNNNQWCNLLIHTNETGKDYVCDFITFVQNKAKKENIKIEPHIPNELWDSSFIEFMQINHLKTY